MSASAKKLDSKLDEGVKKPKTSSYRQALKFVKTLSPADKKKLFMSMKKTYASELLRDVRVATEGFPLSIEDIQSEVDLVRKSRYADKTRK